MKVLLTGAGGFIGGAIWRALETRGHVVVPVDAYIVQAHSPEGSRDDRVHRIDLRSEGKISKLLIGVDVVCHQAAMVGSGVATADLPHFASHNDLATAVLLAAMADQSVGKLVLASSMVVYGDGRYACSRHGQVVPQQRPRDDLAAGQFDPACPRCGGSMTWRSVTEDAALTPRSSYAASKVAQEHYAASWARQLPGRVVALRYHNVYGAWMPQDTPYSGVAALFRSALARGEPPRVFEDGQQMRDFVEVEDVARANVLAIEAVDSHPTDSFTAYNIASGRPISIADVALTLASAASGSAPVTTGEYRPGDVRHIVASPSLASRELGFTAEIDPIDGLSAFAYAPLRERYSQVKPGTATTECRRRCWTNSAVTTWTMRAIRRQRVGRSAVPNSNQGTNGSQIRSTSPLLIRDASAITTIATAAPPRSRTGRMVASSPKVGQVFERQRK